jgi:ADP-ribose pyrophosphatase YjhB (NUDIX family)
VSDPRLYPERPFLAVSAAIVRDGKVLLVRRAREPARGVYTLPGGVVEIGETIAEALRREISEEIAATIEPVAFAGQREVIARDAEGRVKRHFVILCFAARLSSGELRPNDEVAEIRWTSLDELAGLETTEGLVEIVTAAFAQAGETAR